MRKGFCGLLSWYVYFPCNKKEYIANVLERNRDTASNDPTGVQSLSNNRAPEADQIRLACAEQWRFPVDNVASLNPSQTSSTATALPARSGDSIFQFSSAGPQDDRPMDT